ncbi:MAG: cytochrome c [Desulfobacteraceae bacterium]|nr:cytochrome c [Desulfobacteraceae bacterium]
MKKFLLPAMGLAVLLSSGLWGLSFYDRNFRFGRMWETPAIRPHESVLPLMEEGGVPFSGGEELYREADGLTLKSPIAPVKQADLLEGKRLYGVFCGQCHGVNYDGKGTVGQSFTPLPANLKSPEVQALAEGVMFQRISYGNPPSGRQPPLATSIAMTDRWKIIAFVQSLETGKSGP